ncbi:MAG: hypothetical protein ACLS4Z_05770 [Christensenellaceae bacterium]
MFNSSNAFTGGIRADPADVLTSSPYPPAQGVTACYLTKGTGEIVSVADGMPGGSVFELCETDYERKIYNASIRFQAPATEFST